MTGKADDWPDLSAVRAELFESAVRALVDAGASEDDARRMLAEITEKFRADLARSKQTFRGSDE